MSLLDKFVLTGGGTLVPNFDLYAEAQARCCGRRRSLVTIARASDRFSDEVTVR